MPAAPEAARQSALARRPALAPAPDPRRVVGNTAMTALARPAGPVENPLVEAMAQFASLRPTGSGAYAGVLGGRSTRLNARQYAELRASVLEQARRAIRHASVRMETAVGRYREQRDVDARHWVVAPIVKAFSSAVDPGARLVELAQTSDDRLTRARAALEHGDYVTAARLIGEGELAAERAATAVYAYIEGIIGTAETTVTVLQGVKTASAVIFFLCAVAASGGTAGAAAGAVGLEAGATTTLFGVTASTATWATVVGTTAAIAEEVGVGIVRAADGDKVDWAEIAVDAAVQIIVARFSPGLGNRLSGQIGRAAAANPALRGLIARVGFARVVTVATTLVLHEGSQMLMVAARDTVRALRGRPITWAEFGRDMFDRLTDPLGLLMAGLAGALGGTHPEPSRRPTPASAASGAAPKPPSRSPTDTADWRPVNKELGLVKPRTKTTPAPKPPPGHTPTTAEQEFLPTPAERSAAYAKEVAKSGPPKTGQGTPIAESAQASPRGEGFTSATAGTRRGVRTSIRADQGEAQLYRKALGQGEIGLERPQGSNVAGRADFVTAARDPSGEMWIIATDAKTTSSSSSSSPAPQPGLRPGWTAQVKAAVDRVSLGNPTLEAEIQAAFAAGRIWVRQGNANLSPAGQGSTSLGSAPLPTPWGPLLEGFRRRRDQ